MGYHVDTTVCRVASHRCQVTQLIRIFGDDIVKFVIFPWCTAALHFGVERRIDRGTTVELDAFAYIASK